MTAPATLPPHPILKDYYGDSAERRGFLTRIFDESARDYDWINGLIGLGSGAWYRRYALRRAGLRPGMRVLDVATGTGAVARAACRILRGTGFAAGLDPSAGMLEQSRRVSSHPLLRGEAERLPFRDGAFDFLSMGYALRHVDDLRATFREYGRVLRPGGIFCLLDFCRPTTTAGYRVASLFLEHFIPWVSGLFSGGPSARRLMKYCWETLDRCVPPPVTLAALKDTGYTDVRCTRWFGVFVEYFSTAPGSTADPGAPRSA